MGSGTTQAPFNHTNITGLFNSFTHKYFLTAIQTCHCQHFRFKSGKRLKIFSKKFYTVKSIRRFYGKITGNQLPVHFPLLFTGARKHFQES